MQESEAVSDAASDAERMVGCAGASTLCLLLPPPAPPPLPLGSARRSMVARGECVDDVSGRKWRTSYAFFLSSF